jgi:N-acetylmuramoyl-L-alanine amidase
MKSPLIALCVGHSRFIGARRDGGAVSVGGISEWDYNLPLAERIASRLSDFRVRSIIVSHYLGGGYSSAMRWLAGHLREIGVAGAIELHFNSASPTARGHEWLYWASSPSSRLLAEELDNSMSMQLPPNILPVRGPKPRNSKSRGAEFLRLTHCPAVIAEPFFGSNAEDWHLAATQQNKFVHAIANGIDEWLEGES